MWPKILMLNQTLVLQLTLSDGVQEVEAMEFKPIPCISINLTPGTKLKLMGPIMVRKGRIMLEERNIKCLGGSVDDLVIKNAAENVLARALGLEENPNPFRIDEAALEVQTENNTTRQATQLIQNINPSIRNSVTNPPHRTQIPTINEDIPPEFMVDDDLLRELETHFEEESVANQNIQSRNIKNKSSIANHNSLGTRCLSPDIFDVNEDDDELLNQHLDLIENNTINRVTQPKPGEIITLDDSFDNIDIDSHLDNIDEEMANMPCSTQKIETFKRNIKSPTLVKTPKLSLSKPLPQKKMTQSKLNFGCNKLPKFDKEHDDDDFETPFSGVSTTNHKGTDLFKKPCNSKNTTEIKSKILNSSVCLSSLHKQTVGRSSIPVQPTSTEQSRKLNIITIEKLNSLIPNMSKGNFKLKVKFMSSAERLKLTTQGFYLIMKVEDSTGVLAVELDPGLAENLAGMSAERLKQLRMDAYHQDIAARNEIRQALSNIMDKIKRLNNVVEVQVIRGEKYPILTKILDVT
ncbi:recQ-mediated genome instability protein 1-like isoform X2 [Anthonomus grandis grandis]|uniref:recQ-mediated genome instability protein 1-like isoform X2 n=1 Tax=Anthonomus grandis grandis TaxID=2921223 RepID=UPI002164FFCB|nr:recQ-mediated genome instability protein 1-like isoform X2 [Anthonomus grandis grandis]